ncbi:tyrosine-type recombinase/integrase [Streptomyces sp. MBT56]|uniref:site-specific integrase n=1 Tax=unclassified Streptomyces TaxID=2593676 RepID=UPI00190CEA46|nr:MULTISPECIES: tyrosine-type recombinase/integrase [unclassified Streptomyces]MBK3555670.1 tyrosine-type recombinase/integrase [Streptomyces sp. MBT56]MBK3602413.1 tyrosine-type recombinase/integrase [Streptomyces sp. MBT54]MBK3617282.1 tyrosine-type recombinase/integrase [Streptomyces sp. MBT98]
MATSRRAGGITKRCECRGPEGSLLGTACPQLTKKNHGKLLLRQELPLDANGQRRPFRRTGYATVTMAQADLDKLRAILDLVDADDEDAARRVGDLLQGVMKGRKPIPDVGEVKRRLGVGVELDGKMTMSQLFESWLGSKKTRQTTTNGYRSHVRVHLDPGIGHHRVDRFGVGQAQTFFDAITERNDTIRAENAARREQEQRAKWARGGRPPAAERPRLEEERARLAAMPPYRRVTGPATVQSIRRTLRAALNYAIKKQVTTFNAAQHVELVPAARPKGLLWTDERVTRWRETGRKPSPVMVWTPAQLGAFLDAAEQHELYAFFHLVAHHGFRRGEGAGQDWENVSFERRTVTVAKELVVDGWAPIETDPKTSGSAGTVKIDVGTVAVLREHKARQEAQREKRLKAGKGWTDTGKVFTQDDGSWVHPETFSDAFREILATTDLPPINLRDLRHGAAALVKAGGGDLHDAKVKLRHSTIVLTSDTYMELFEDYEDELTERAAAVVPRARKANEEQPQEALE